MNADPKRIIVTESCCHACSVHTVRVHHENFPEMRVEGMTAEKAAGHWVYLLDHAPHTLRGVENSLVLLTVMFH